MNFEYSEFDANDLLRELEGMFKVKLFNNPSVDLICEDSVQSIIMYSERQRIIQVMANLIHNAIKFTKQVRYALVAVWRERMRFTFMYLILELEFERRTARNIFQF